MIFRCFVFLILVFTTPIFLSQTIQKEMFVVDKQDDTLWGSISIPNGVTDTTQTLVLIIAGSGPTDRDGNNNVMKNNSLLFLSEELAKFGFPSIRYDKRGVKSSANAYIREDSLTFENNVVDAQLFYEYAIAKGYSKVAIAGHSEGSLIGILLANKMKAFKYISISGAGRPISEVLKEQYGKTAPIVRDSAHKVIDILAKGTRIDTLSPWLYSVFRPQIQNYIISWMQINPKTEFQKYQSPILIVQGEKDSQVSVEDAKILKESCSHCELVLIKDMNHVLKKIGDDPKENKSSYNNPNLPLHSDLILSIVNFLKKD